MLRTFSTVNKSNLENRDLNKKENYTRYGKILDFIKPLPFSGYKRKNDYLESLSKLKKRKFLLQINAQYERVRECMII